MKSRVEGGGRGGGRGGLAWARAVVLWLLIIDFWFCAETSLPYGLPYWFHRRFVRTNSDTPDWGPTNLVPISTLQRTQLLDLKNGLLRGCYTSITEGNQDQGCKTWSGSVRLWWALSNFPRFQSTALPACSHPLAEHIQGFLSGPPERLEKTIMHYKNCLRVIFDHTPIIPQTSKSSKGQVLTSLTPNYLCLQCSTTTTEHDCLEHGNETSHRFCNIVLYSNVMAANSYRRRVKNW